MHDVAGAVRFYMGQNEGCSPGQTWESSEKLLHMVREGQYVILVKGVFIAIKHLLYKRFSVTPEELMSP